MLLFIHSTSICFINTFLEYTAIILLLKAEIACIIMLISRTKFLKAVEISITYLTNTKTIF